MFWEVPKTSRREETRAWMSSLHGLPGDTVELTVEICPAGAEHRHVVTEVIGGGDLLRTALVEFIVVHGYFGYRMTL